MSDARSILQSQYKDASRLDARIQLHAKYSTNTQGLHAWVFEHLCLPPICQVLEVGCGSGQLRDNMQELDALVARVHPLRSPARAAVTV